MTTENPLSRPTRVFDLIRYQLQRFPNPDAIRQKEDGVWKSYSTQEISDTIDAVAWGLKSLSIQKGDRIATIIESSRIEWNFLDNAIMSLGAVHVPIYPNIPLEEHQYILSHSGAKLVFVSSRRLYEIVNQLRPQLPDLLAIYSYDLIEGVPHWKTLRDTGAAELEKDSNRQTLEAIRAEVLPEDLATLIYTSGTTGIPKGVMLTHTNLVSNCIAASPLLATGATETTLSFLPLCHIFERTAINVYIYSGASICYAENLDTIATNLREIKPHVFTTVPRLIEKVYERILERGRSLKGFQHWIFFWALDLAKAFHPERKPTGLKALQYTLADRLVYSKWREAMGGRIRGIVSGSAALSPQLALIFWGAKIPIFEAYGPTEASPGIAGNLMEGIHKIGTVGPIFPGGEVKIASDGEILYRGPNVMKGYYKQPELTAETIDPDGWLHTGDVGEFDGPFLKITDRKKEIFKTSGGKYIAPQQIENKLKESKYISQVMAIGENRKFPAALIVPNFAVLAEAIGKGPLSPSEIKNDPAAFALVDSEIQRLNGYFGRYMQVKKFALLDQEWGIASGELTPTLKLKRKQILSKYATEIEAIYEAYPVHNQ
jgi:long-chain acyl-CoA synthetase